MKPLTKDARGFVEGVVTYLKSEGKSTSAIPKVQALFRKVTSQARKEGSAIVKTSVTISPNERQALTRVLTKLVGHDLATTFQVDTQLLGGFYIQVGDWIVDASLLGQLNAMVEVLL